MMAVALNRKAFWKDPGLAQYHLVLVHNVHMLRCLRSTPQAQLLARQCESADKFSTSPSYCHAMQYDAMRCMQCVQYNAQPYGTMHGSTGKKTVQCSAMRHQYSTFFSRSDFSAVPNDHSRFMQGLP